MKILCSRSNKSPPFLSVWILYNIIFYHIIIVSFSVRMCPLTSPLCPVYTRNEIDCVIITTSLDYWSLYTVHTLFAGRKLIDLILYEKMLRNVMKLKITLEIELLTCISHITSIYILYYIRLGQYK